MLMKKSLTPKVWGSLLAIFLLFSTAYAQKTVTGKVTDPNGAAVAGASITVKGGTIGTSTDASGSFSLTLSNDAKTLVITAVGFTKQEMAVEGSDLTNIVLIPAPNDLDEVVVIGYGVARKRDITGAVASVKEKDFNKGVNPAPDQLIQGKVAGVQVVNNSGAPGAGTTFRIRGASSLRAGNGPLFVVDGVQLSNNNTRPDAGLSPELGNSTPGGNPLNFINPADIESMEVLKDASAAAIYGSRGANGVVLITTKKGKTGDARVDVNASVGVANILKRLEVLSGDQYRTALGEFGFPTNVSTAATPTANFGGNVDALDEVLRSGIVQNYGVGFSSGNDNAKYRLSFGYMNQDGIIRKTNFTKYTAGFNSSFKLLNNRRLGLDFSVLTSQIDEDIAPISNNAGFRGSMIGQALQWNPTRPLRKANGDLDIEYGADAVNPLAFSEAYFDNAKVTTVLANVAPSYKITNNLIVRSQIGITYATGTRKNYTTAFINVPDIAFNPNTGRGGEAGISQNELNTQQITNTLSYNADLNKRISLNAVVGHEYIKTTFGGNNSYARNFLPTDRPYTYFMATSDPSSRRLGSFQDPTNELQSFFTRAIVNVDNKYIFTGTFRADGSSKFGENNRYGYFPSLAGAWNIDKENFMEDLRMFTSLKARASWGITGNQDFPAGASQTLYTVFGNNPGFIQQSNTANPNLKWESTTTLNFGLDFAMMANRLTGTFDYFERKTKDILFPRDAADPVAPISATRWENIDGTIANSGLEVTLNYRIIDKQDLSWDFGINATFLKNELTDFAGEIPTGEVTGQGLSGAFAQLIKSGYPINTFYLRQFTGIDKATGISQYQGGDEKFFLGSPNPTMLLGFTTNVGYKKWSLEIAGNGSFGQYIYNNTANAVLAFNNLGKRNIGLSEYETAKSLGERPVNPTSASTRYLESGDFFRLANATVSYRLGDIGKSIRNATVYVTAQNLFILTNFTGFDPEVNVSKPLNGIPSFGMEYTPYPTSRTINFGINFSL